MKACICKAKSSYDVVARAEELRDASPERPAQEIIDEVIAETQSKTSGCREVCALRIQGILLKEVFGGSAGITIAHPQILTDPNSYIQPQTEAALTFDCVGG